MTSNLGELFEKDVTKIIAGILLVFVPIFSYTFLFPFFQNCINIKLCMIVYVILGAILGLGIARYLQDRIFELIHQFQLFIASAIICAILFPLVAISINLLIQTSEESVKANVLKVEGYHQSRFGELSEGESLDGIFIFLQIRGETLRLNADPNSKVGQRTAEYKYGDQVPIIIHHGLLGLKWARFTS